MGTIRTGREKRDLSKGQTLYQDPDLDRIRPFGGVKREEKITRGVLASGSTLETLGGLVAVVSAIVGFATAPFTMAGVATIALGVALFAQGIAIVSRWSDTIAHLPRPIEGTKAKRDEVVSGVGTELFGGLAGIVLGVIGLAGAHPLVVYPVAVTVFGCSLLLGGAAQPDLAYVSQDRNPRFARVTYSALQTSGGIMVIVGIAASVMGVLALLGVGPILTLTLAALLSTACSLVLAGGVLTARLLHRFI